MGWSWWPSAASSSTMSRSIAGCGRLRQRLSTPLGLHGTYDLEQVVRGGTYVTVAVGIPPVGGQLVGWDLATGGHRRLIRCLPGLSRLVRRGAAGRIRECP